MPQTKCNLLGKNIKNKGISLPVAFITSMFVLVLALYTLDSITRSFQRTVGIERSNRVFFASESGVEAALFHKNVRGKGAHFNWEEWENAGSNLCKDNPTELECPNWLKTIRLKHAETGAESRWKIESRFKPEAPGNLTYHGEIKEFQTIEIPLYYDAALRTTDSPSINNALKNTNIIIRIPANALSSKISNYIDFNFGDQRSIVTATNPPIDPDTQKPDKVLIDWSLSRFHTTNGVQTFVPDTNLGHPCVKDDGTNSPLYCENEARTASAQEINLQSTSIDGSIEPCTDSAGCKTNLNDFFADSNSTDYTLRLQSLLPYETVDNSGNILEKISSLPFRVELPNENNDLPDTKYTITSTVIQGDYSRETAFTVNEGSGIGAFNYVIFE